MDLDVERQVNLGQAPQALAQNFFLNLELVIVGGVLIMASAASGKVWARGRDAMRRRLKDRVGLGSREAGLLLDEGGFDFFSGKDKGDEHGLAASTGFIGVRISGQAGKAVAAVDQLFDCEEQELILRHGNGKTAQCRLAVMHIQPREIPFGFAQSL